MDGRERLGIYLNDHVLGSSAGLELFRRAAAHARGTPAGRELERLSDEVDADREALLAVVRALGLPVRRYKVLTGWALEKAGRLKPNGHVLTRSPLSMLVELEGLALGVQGKAAGWRALRAVADRYDALDPAALDALIDRAERQFEALERLRRQCALDVLAPGPA